MSSDDCLVDTHSGRSWKEKRFFLSIMQFDYFNWILNWDILANIKWNISTGTFKNIRKPNWKVCRFCLVGHVLDCIYSVKRWLHSIRRKLKITSQGNCQSAGSVKSNFTDSYDICSRSVAVNYPEDQVCFRGTVSVDNWTKQLHLWSVGIL